MKPIADLKGKLLAGHFTSSAPQSSTLSDPLEPVHMVLTLDQLQPYEYNPRVKKNPLYEEIKESIRSRGLDSPPTVTRRPGETHYIIMNGGNTRLAALGDLWRETRDEKFFKFDCLFKPWPKRGDIVALVGHMAENDLRGNLLWIERCLGIAQCKERYKEEDGGKDISQRELARRLQADGYTINQSHISRMEQTLQYLFPYIPNVLWNGMGRDSTDKLLQLRSNAEKAWQKLTEEKGLPASGATFDQVFSNALGVYDDEPEAYVFSHFQDDLIGAMTDALRENGVSYELILFEIEVAQDPKRAIQFPVPPAPEAGGAQVQSAHPTPTAGPGASEDQGPTRHGSSDTLPGTDAGGAANRPGPAPQHTPPSPPSGSSGKNGELPPPPVEHTGKVVSIPVTTGGLAPVSDVWAIYPQQDSIEALRNLADLIAMEVAGWAGVLDHMTSTQGSGLGFTLLRPETFKSAASETAWQLLASLSGNSPAEEIQPIAPDDLAELLIQHLPDDLVIKVFRMIRLARRAKELIGEI
ncbi:ParB family protein [Pseudomonas lopnurensis]|uniref:ParB family protein n=1 Tax=Pseudomonas lopnurensis TaxID=1477517 RepID=UPI0028A60BD9|nr:ParB family protein [Pseudomonas lopnurensis]